MYYYWVVTEQDKHDIVKKPMFLFISKKLIKFKLGDKLYLSGKTGYLQKRKNENGVFYPVKLGKNLSFKENIILFDKLHKKIISLLIGVSRKAK